MVSKATIICGIDPSIRSTGLAILLYEKGKAKPFFVKSKTTLNNKKTKFPSKWATKKGEYELFEFYLKDKAEEVDLFVFENYSYGSVGHLADLGELTGLFKYYIDGFDKPFVTIPPATVKRLVGGSGRASKEDVAKELKKFVSNYDDIEFNTTDESDAIAIAIAYVLKLEEDESKKS